ncbi:cytochrome b5-like heme steroid binding domain-containing protein [Colletotrichum karsti]|uniref:Cytochrome b5-like heme steroid binding domain-containing protein n=1 Tax=Colletotrichum karsti TaxID=1095194 RepID=A0A9P6IEK2_9PEZI|nr:cytochrome b5-like heme steroid binding domain-containing protein [Colletotrichum karsti]KAF9882053.1 cytochrome b5-like heme steroid binding domain-containing protein [Colletotrichum karsti]
MAGKFEPKNPVELAPPKDDPITLEELAKADVFAGKDASRALGKTSTKPEDVSADWSDLTDKEKGVLNDWITFFSKRYNVVGRVAGATNTE